MAILYFQILIIFTIYLASLFGKKSLIIVCAAWTVFTLSNAFLPSLILLQLITIWACYWFLKRNKNSAVQPHPVVPAGEKASTSSSSPQPQPLDLKPAVMTPAESQSSGGAFLRSLDSLSTTITSFSDSVALSLDVQKATASLEAVMFTEKLWTEKSLERAQCALKLDAWRQEHGEIAWAHYLQARAKFTKALEPNTQALAAAPSLTWVAPDFSSVLGVGATPLATAIEVKKRQLQDERDRFFSDIVLQVWANAPLRNAMREELLKLGGHDTWDFISGKAAQSNKPLARLTFGVVLGTLQATRADLQDPEIQSRGLTAYIPGFLRKQELETRVRALELPYLIHFTRVENLPSIMQHGLCSITALTDKKIDFRFNDHLRLDGRPNAVCMSIGHPNDKMFASYRWKSPEQGWAVLVVDRCVLWSLDTAFCNHNAADNRIRQQPLAALKTVAAFDNLFSPQNNLPSRAECRLQPGDPSDVQAEVLVFDTLKPALINSVVFSDQNSLQQYKDCVADKPVHVHTESYGFLGARTYARKSGWTY